MREITTWSEGLEDGSLDGFKKINEALFVAVVENRLPSVGRQLQQIFSLFMF